MKFVDYVYPTEVHIFIHLVSVSARHLNELTHTDGFKLRLCKVGHSVCMSELQQASKEFSSSGTPF